MISGPSSVRVVMTPGGYATTARTLEEMAAIVRREHTDPNIRTLYRAITYGLPSMDYDAEIAAVWNFILGHVRYQRDPIGAEHVTLPTEMVRQINEEGLAAEDCESLATFAATLFAAGGIPSRFDAMGSVPGKFSHCALQVQNPRTKEWTSFDPIGAWGYPGSFGLGDTLAVDGGERELWDLDGDRVDSLSGFLDGLFGDSASDLATVKAVGDPIASVIGKLGPYGALVGGAWQLSTGAAQLAVGTPKKQSTPAASAASASAGAAQPPKFPPNGEPPAVLPTSTPMTGARASKAQKIPTWGYVAGGVVLAKLLGVI